MKLMMPAHFLVDAHEIPFFVCHWGVLLGARDWDWVRSLTLLRTSEYRYQDRESL